MPKFAPGFRFSVADMMIIILGLLGATALQIAARWGGFVVGFVLANFFLFCNVFRISRPLELAWSGVFVALASGTILFGFPGWLLTVAISLCITVGAVAIEMRKASYHGIGWRWINPGLPAWWKSNVARAAERAIDD